MKVLLLFSHPVESSFGAAVHETARAALVAAGHDVDDCDLYAEGFDPVLSRRDRLTYHDHPENMELVADYCHRLDRAEALVIVTPIWNYGFPAILKGYFDRVWLPGVSFDLVDGKLKSKLHHIRKVAACLTYGGTALRTFLAGDPPGKIVKRVIRAQIHPRGSCRLLPLYDMNNNTQETRIRYLETVAQAMAAL